MVECIARQTNAPDVSIQTGAGEEVKCILDHKNHTNEKRAPYQCYKFEKCRTVLVYCSANKLACVLALLGAFSVCGTIINGNISCEKETEIALLEHMSAGLKPTACARTKSRP